jgi:hypothetical protein
MLIGIPHQDPFLRVSSRATPIGPASSSTLSLNINRPHYSATLPLLAFLGLLLISSIHLRLAILSGNQRLNIPEARVTAAIFPLFGNPRIDIIHELTPNDFQNKGLPISQLSKLVIIRYGMNLTRIIS